MIAPLPPSDAPPKIFISYSRTDQAFVDHLQAALESSGFEIFVDRKDIANGEEFWARIQELITHADTVIFVVSQKSIASSICGKELAYTRSLGKRLIPLIWNEIDGTLPQPLNEIHWVSAEFYSRSGMTDEASFAAMLSDLQRAINLGDLVWVREHTKWVGRAVDWDMLGRSDVSVLRSGDITAAQAWLSRRSSDSPSVPEVLESFLNASIERERKDRRRTTRLQALIATAISIAIAILLLGTISVLRLGSAIGARTSRTLTELASQQFELNNFESAARYSLAGMNGADSILVGYDDVGARAILEAAVLNNRLTHIASEHRGPIERLVISPDGKQLLSTTEDATAQIWDVTSGILTCVLPIYGKPISSCGTSKAIRGIETNTNGPEDENPALAEFSPKGDVVLTAKGTIARLWNARTGSLQYEFDHPDSADIVGIQSISFSPDGQLVATGGLDNVVRLWSTQTGKLVREFKENRDYVRVVTFSPDGQTLLAVGNDGVIRLWTIGSGALQRAIDSGMGRLFFGSFSPTGDRFVAAGDDSSARMWETKTGAPLQTFRGSKGRISDVSFSPDGKALLLVSADGSANLLNALTGDVVQTYAGQIYAAKFSADSTYVLTLSRDRSAQVWDTNLGTLDDSFVGHNSTINDAVFLPDGIHIVTGDDDSTLRTWSRAVAEPKLRMRHGDVVQIVGLSADGSRVMTSGGQTKIARIWDGNTGRLLKELGGNGAPIEATYLSSNGRRLVTSSRDGSVSLWDTDSGHLQKTFLASDTSVTAVSMSPNDGFIAATSLGKDHDGNRWHYNAEVWDALSGKLIIHARENSLSGVSFSPDGKIFVINTGVLNFYDLASGAIVRSIHSACAGLGVEFSARGNLVVCSGGQVVHWHAQGSDFLIGPKYSDVNATDVSADDKYVLTSHNDGIARLWDLATGRLLQSFVGHKDRLTVGRFLDDGEHIITAGNDRTARLWDIHSGKTLMILRGHATTISNIIVSRDQSHFVTLGFGDEFALLWSNPVWPKTGRDLVYAACHEMLLDDTATSLAILNDNERSSAPSVDPIGDYRAPGDVCKPVSPWHRLIAAFSG